MLRCERARLRPPGQHNPGEVSLRLPAGHRHRAKRHLPVLHRDGSVMSLEHRSRAKTNIPRNVSSENLKAKMKEWRTKSTHFFRSLYGHFRALISAEFLTILSQETTRCKDTEET